MRFFLLSLLLLLELTQSAAADSASIGIYASSYVASAPSGACTSLNGFTHCRPITINSTYVPATQSEFPVMISGTYSYLASTGHSGFIQNTTTLNSQTVPADLVFTSDSGCSTTLNWEIESWNATTGAIVAFVNTPISSSSSTVIYMCYGKASVTTYQATATSTWDSNFKAVYHFANGSTLSLIDSTVNNITTTTNTGGTTPTAVAGFIDGAMQTYGGTGTAGSGIDFPLSTIGPSPPFAMSGWFYPTTSAQQTLFGSTQSIGDLEVRLDSTNVVDVLKNNVALLAATTATVTLNQWNFVAVTVDSSDNIIVNINGTSQTFSGAYNNLPSNGVNTIAWDRWSDAGLIGYSDECELSNVARSTNWITTTYNNQSSPSSFYTVGTQL